MVVNPARSAEFALGLAAPAAQRGAAARPYRRPMIVLITGPVRSGKSTRAASVARDLGGPVTHVLTTRSARIGPALIFQRLWQTCSIDKVLMALLHGRRFEFSVERAIFLTVL